METDLDLKLQFFFLKRKLKSGKLIFYGRVNRYLEGSFSKLIVDEKGDYKSISLNGKKCWILQPELDTSYCSDENLLGAYRIEFDHGAIESGLPKLYFKVSDGCKQEWIVASDGAKDYIRCQHRIMGEIYVKNPKKKLYTRGQKIMLQQVCQYGKTKAHIYFKIADDD